MEVPIPTKLSIDEINFAPYNPRSISKEDFANLLTSIDRFGFAENIVVNDRMHPDFPDDERGKLTLVSGHMRTRAARELGYDTLPAIILSLSPDEEKALNVAMNRISGEWDDQLLAELLYSLDDEMQGLTGFHDDELSKLLDSVSGEEDEEEDESPEVDDKNPPVSVLGEVYQLGPHRLMCGDSTSVEVISALMNGAKPELLLTDPPYGIKVNNDWQDKLHPENQNYGKGEILNDAGDLNLAILKNYPKRIVFGFPYLQDESAEGWLVWDKEPGFEGRSLTSPIEMAYSTCWKGFRAIRLLWSGYLRESHSEEKVGHPTQKPTRLLSDILKDNTQRGDKVLDLFGGSGSTLIACDKLDRQCYMMELDPKYVDVIRKRYAKHIGEEDWIACTPVIEPAEVTGG